MVNEYLNNFLQFDNYHVHDTSSNQYNLGESPAAALGICKPYLKYAFFCLEKFVIKKMLIGLELRCGTIS